MPAILLALLAANGLTLRELQERARNNDPRARQAAAQLEGAQGKRDEAQWAWFPNFETLAYIAGPTPERRLPASGDLSTATQGPLDRKLGVTGHVEVQAILPVWTFGKLTAGKDAT